MNEWLVKFYSMAEKDIKADWMVVEEGFVMFGIREKNLIKQMYNAKDVAEVKLTVDAKRI